MAKHQRYEVEFDLSALEPHIDAKTMELHTTKHHQGYTDKLNAALDEIGDSELSEMSIEELMASADQIPESHRQAVINNGGGFVNHNLYFSIMSPDGGGHPTGELEQAISDTFGSFEEFKSEFEAKAAGVFGSGWAWLCVDGEGLILKRTSFQNSPLMMELKPILGIDVWEHAYYLHYQNRRPEYITAFWEVIDWEKVGANYAAAMG